MKKWLLGILLLSAVALGAGMKRGAAEAPRDVALAADAALWLDRHQGVAYFDNGDDEAAISALRRAADAAPDSYADQLNLGIAAVRAGDLALGRAAVARAQALAPEAAAPDYVLGVAEQKAGNAEAAVRHFQRVVEVGQADAPTYYQLGRAAKEAGDPEAAEAAMRQALARNSEHVSARYQLFLLLRDRGDRAGARAALEQVQALRQRIPDFKRSEEALVASIHTEMQRSLEPRPEAPRSAWRFEPRAWPEVTGVAKLEAFDAERDGTGELMLWGAGGGRVWRAAAPGGGVALDGTEVPIDAVAGDLNHDGWTDWVMAGVAEIRCWLGDGAGAFALAPEASMPIAGVRDLALVDIDHEGDPDVLALTGDGLVVWINEGVPEEGAPLRFQRSELAGAPPVNGQALGWCDIEWNEAVDVLALGESGAIFVQNDRQAVFSDATQARGVAELTGRTLALGDANGDLIEDLWVAGDGEILVWLGSVAGVFRHDPAWSVDSATFDRLELGDVDLDGDLDLLAAGATAALFENRGTHLEVRRDVDLAGASAHTWVDFDGDGRLDLAGIDAAGQLVGWQNATESQGVAVRLALTGVRTPGDGRGAAVELRSGAFAARRLARSGVVRFAVPHRAVVAASEAQGPAVNLLRVRWPNGALQALLDVTLDRAPVTIEEPREVAGSCPVLYVEQDSGWVMATDLMGTAPLGFPVAPGEYLTPNPWEYVKLPEGRAPHARAGRYTLVLAEELREVVYLDHFALWSVDHPESLLVVSNYVLSAPPFERPAFWALRDARPPARATDQSGRDLTALVTEADGRAVRAFEPLADPFAGAATEQCVTLEFGDVSVATPVLVMTGWTEWTDGPAERAIAQHRDLATVLPTVERQTPGGTWRPLSAWFGFPSLRSKDIALELGERLVGPTTLRIRTNLRVHWDRILLGDRLSRADTERLCQKRVLVPGSAELFPKGVSILEQPNQGAAEYRYATRRPPVWASQSGLATRYGDVLDLVRAVDDRAVVFTMGDGVRMTFDASWVPPLPPGYKRAFFSEARGWEKEGDYYTAAAAVVAPIPHHGMERYPYVGPPAVAGDPDWAVTQLEYQTRQIGRASVAAAAESDAADAPTDAPAHSALD